MLLWHAAMILCGTDFSPASRTAMTAAAALAHKRDADLLLASVVAHGDVLARGDAEQMLARAAAELRQSLELNVETYVADGLPDEQLLRLATERGARLIVLGAAKTAAEPARLGLRSCSYLKIARAEAHSLAPSPSRRLARRCHGP